MKRYILGLLFVGSLSFGVNDVYRDFLKLVSRHDVAGIKAYLNAYDISIDKCIKGLLKEINGDRDEVRDVVMTLLESTSDPEMGILLQFVPFVLYQNNFFAKKVLLWIANSHAVDGRNSKSKTMLMRAAQNLHNFASLIDIDPSIENDPEMEFFWRGSLARDERVLKTLLVCGANAEQEDRKGKKAVDYLPEDAEPRHREMLTDFDQYYKEHPEEFISIEKKVSKLKNDLLLFERMERFKREKKRRASWNVLRGIK